VKQTLWAFKYTNDITATLYLAEMMCDELIDYFSSRILHSFNFPIAYIFTIPSSSFHNGERNWDQMCKLMQMMKRFPECKNFFAQYEKAFAPLPISHSSVAAQHTLNRSLRIASASQRFSLSDISTLGQHAHIIILDDVTTTGSTLAYAKHLCTEVSRDVSHIHCFAIAH
jgi:predicted amidophosphoribosyltransferase